MYQRKLEKELKYLSSQYPVITLTGPRQAGKSTLAQSAFPQHKYVSLEDPDIRTFAAQDPRSFLAEYHGGAIIDEIQRVPSLLSFLQTVVDKAKIKGQFILTGSHQLALNEAVTQSLAGRTALVTLLPLSLEELPRQELTLDECLLLGSMPGLFYNNMEHMRFYKNYFETYVTRDVRLLVKIKELSVFEKFVRLCAGRAGQLLNLSNLSSEVGVSSQCIDNWISILEASYVVFKLNPFYENINKRLTKTSKLYFFDTGLLCYLLGIESAAQLARDPLRGHIFENFVVTEVIKNLFNKGKSNNLLFYRDSSSLEIDLILQKGRQYLPVEIKSGSTFHEDFIKNIGKFTKILAHNCLPGAVVYGGKTERKAESYSLIAYQNIHRFLDQFW